MALERAKITAAKVFTHHKPDVVDSYELQRTLEDAASKVEPLDPHIRDERTYVGVRDGHQVPVRIFTPLDLDFSLKEGLTATEDWRGTILFFHGGGWVTGQVDLYADACKALARALQRRVVSVDYRLAPESRFPVPLQDCYDVARALFEGRILKDVVPEHIVIMGDSAGGNLAAATCLMARETGDFSPANAILVYPVLNNDYGPDSPYPSVRENGSDYILTAQDCTEYLMLYAEKPEDYENPLLAPMLTADLSGLPRTLVISAELCPLRDEDEAFAQRLVDAGGEVACFRMVDAMHGYLLRPMDASIIDGTHRICRAFLDHAALGDDGGAPDEKPAGTSHVPAEKAAAAGSKAKATKPTTEAPGASVKTTGSTAVAATASLPPEDGGPATGRGHDERWLEIVGIA